MIMARRPTLRSLWMALALALLLGPKILSPVSGADVPLFSMQARLVAEDAGVTYGITPPAIYGRGFQTLITGYIDPDNSNNDYGLYVHSTDDGYDGAGYSTWTQQMKIRPDDGDAADHFGRWMSTTDYTLLVSSPMKNTYKGAAYIFNGTLKHWTQIQKLVASDAKAYDYFGERTAISGNRAILGARGGLAGASTAGRAYIFERSERFGEWSQVAKLVAADAKELQFFGQNVAIYGDYALVSAKNDVEEGSHGGCAYVFQYVTVNKISAWTQQQKITNFDLYEYQSDRDILHTGVRLGDKFFAEDLIIYKTSAAMSVFRTDQEELNQQSVYVYNLTNAGTWSQSQILFYNGTLESGGEFHSSTRLHLRDENLVVRVFGSEQQVEYVFQYQSNGNWSQLQRLAHVESDNKTTPGLFGGYLLENNGTTAIIKSRYRNDSCLLIWMSDHFLDGWDTAVLTVRAPDRTVDTFHPHCDQVDPFKVRYCPRTPEEEGIYIIKIFSATKARFFWEMSFQVYVEKTGTWYKGDFSTTMKFEYSMANNAFAFSNIVNEVFTDKLYGAGTCQRCNMVSRRSWGDLLTPKGDGFFSLFTVNAPYFISDIAGRILDFTGKVCDGINSYVCYQQQAEGLYILRLGGGLFGRETGFPYAGARWEGCGANGTDRHQLVFNISNGVCSPVQVFDYGDISLNDSAVPNRCRRPDVFYFHENVFGDAYSKGDMGYRRLQEEVQRVMVDDRFDNTPFHSSVFVP